MQCLLCGNEQSLERQWRLSLSEVLDILAGGDADRRQRLGAEIQRLWQQDYCELWRCGVCQFCFAVPHRSGDQGFYNVFLADSHYPPDRWEFGISRKLVADWARARPPERPLKYLEIGGGDGNFLLPLLAEEGVQPRIRPTLSDYSPSAINKLRSLGIDAGPWSLDELLTRPDLIGQCDVICAFQCVHMMTPVDAIFRAFRQLLAPGGSLLMSVINGRRLEFYDRHVGVSNVPPLYTSRFVRETFPVVAQHYGLELVESRSESGQSLFSLWRVAFEKVGVQSSRPGTLAWRVKKIRLRRLRGPLKAALTLAMIPGFLPYYTQLEGRTIWAHFRRAQ